MMPDFPFDIVLFDLDGTLVDSARDLCPAINHGLGVLGRTAVSEEATRNMIGGGTDMMLTRALKATGGMIGKEEYRRVMDAVLEHYWANITRNTVPFDGCTEMLETLQAGGMKLAICTNKSEKPARQLLDALHLTRFFSAIYGGDTLGRENAKPKPDMLIAAAQDCGGGRAVMIGDSSFDIRAGKGAKMPTIACAFGYNDIPVEQLGADRVINALAQLPAALGDLA